MGRILDARQAGIPPRAADETPLSRAHTKKGANVGFSSELDSSSSY